MNSYPEDIENLILRFKQLPGVGKRGAERLVSALLEWENEDLKELGSLIYSLPERVGRCPGCAAWAEQGKLCGICSDSSRENGILCVVETMPQMLAVEKGGSYRGRYLILGGKLSPLDGENGENLNFDMLEKAAKSGKYKEIILALSPDVEGRATAAYLTELLADCPVTLSQPAMGLPAGSNLSFADSATISAAFSGRRNISGK